MEEEETEESFRRVMRSNGLKLSRFQERDLGCDVCSGWKLAPGGRESRGSYWTGLGRFRGSAPGSAEALLHHLTLSQ